MNKHIEINPARLNHVLELYAVTWEDILAFLNKGRKKLVSLEDVSGKTILTSRLKKIDDEFFGKGLSYYTDPAPPSKKKSTSIFFRKRAFNAKLTQADRWRVNQVEAELHLLKAIITLSGYELNRSLPHFAVSDSPIDAATEVRKTIGMENLASQPTQGRVMPDRDYLKWLIALLAEQGILVHEFVEQHNRKKKTSWEGLFLAPYTIVVKRQQAYLKREIFTLAHELGHYLLDCEEIDKNIFDKPEQELKETENWCNAFAYHFLLGDAVAEVPALFDLQPDTDNQDIQKISAQYHVSRLAIYTHWATSGRMDWELYQTLKSNLAQKHEENERVLKLQREEQKRRNPDKPQGGSVPKPIHSPLEEDIYRHAYFEGTVEELDIVNNFKPNRRSIESGFVEKFLYE